jgi:3-hydroxy-9,10-secoandrosta-1,3,5(10)-triene-9,17-dione monooxygenase
MTPSSARAATRQEILERVGAMVPRVAARAAGAEEARQLPAESARELLHAGLARILVPARFGGYELDFETWLDAVVEISKADASHGWCASLMTHHAHIITQFSEEAQRHVWAHGPDVSIAASVAPAAQIARTEGGYRVSGQNSSFASGVDHSAWAMVGGLALQGDTRDWKLFLIPRDEYEVRDTWFTAGMRATGSRTIVTADVFVPDARVLSFSDLRAGTGPGSGLHESPIYRTPFYHYAPLTFAAIMLGAARGAYEQFREWTRTRKAMDGTLVAEKTSVQVRMARAAADLDAAELLLRRAAKVPSDPEMNSPQLVARSVRDFARASELAVAAIDAIMALCGTAGFATSHPIQRAWRDIHFASTHVSLNTETNYAHFGRTELGLTGGPTEPGQRHF